METAYNGPDNRDGNQENKEHTPKGSDKRSLENSGPDKSKDFKVLHKDGSLGDLKDQDVPGGGALEGTVGLGT